MSIVELLESALRDFFDVLAGIFAQFEMLLENFFSELGL